MELVVAAVNEQGAQDDQQRKRAHQQEQQDGAVDVMVDSGAATPVCPLWFDPLQRGEGPRLRTVTDDNIILPLHECDVQQPILAAGGTKLSHQSQSQRQPNKITRSKGFTAATLRQKDGLYFLPTWVAPVVPLPDNMVRNIFGQGTQSNAPGALHTRCQHCCKRWSTTGR